MNKFFLLLILCIVKSSLLFSQKRALTHADYDSWKRVKERLISPDGKSIAFVISPQEGDSYAMVKNKTETKISRANELKFSFDNTLLFGKIKPSFDLIKKEKKLKKKKEELTKDSLFVFNLTNSKLSKIPHLISFALPEESGNSYAYLTEPIVKKDSSTKKAKKYSEENGYLLTFQNSTSTQIVTIPYVKEYSFAKNGKSLVFNTTGIDSTQKAGIYVLNTESGHYFSVLESKGTVHQMSLDATGLQLACVVDLDTSKKTIDRNPSLFFWKKGQEKAGLLTDKTKLDSPENYVSEAFKLKFSEDGNKLFFGRRPKSLEPDTSLLPEEQVKLDLWHYKDEQLMPSQISNLEADKKRSYLSVYHIADNKTIHIGGPNLPKINLSKDANEPFVLGINPRPYSNAHWDWHDKHDAYIINVKTGLSTPIYKGLMSRNPMLSPSTEYVAYFSLSDTAYYTYELKTQKTYKITNDKIFTDEAEDDHPDFPESYGIVGFTKNTFLIQDKFDLWEVSPFKPNSLKRLTKGREKNTIYRYIKLDPEEKTIDLSQKLLLHSRNLGTYQEGFAFYNAGSISPVLASDHSYLFTTKAKNSTQFLYIKYNFKTVPDLFMADLNSSETSQLSFLNDQIKAYNWGQVEHVSWQSLDGINLKGLLYKPENFDSTKKYPMITYFYEKNSENIHQFYEPAPTPSIINFSYYTSNEYIVFVPDIVYKIGYPGESAYNCVIPGVQSIINKGFVDPLKLGIQGHSWGGYQTAYIITKTKLFAAAESGAPVVNMTSAFGGIRWGTGSSRQAQYETGQSRIGGNIWDKYPLYIENSPLFSLNKVQTPVLILHNDADDAVPWYQGIEMFMGLKRLYKPTWLLNYNGEKHGLIQRYNRKDFSVRMADFFDHYLKNKPAPAWLLSGIPATEKGLKPKGK